MKIVAIKPKYSTRRRSPDPQKPMKFEDMFAAKLEKQVNDLTPIVFGKSMTIAPQKYANNRTFQIAGRVITSQIQNGIFTANENVVMTRKIIDANAMSPEGGGNSRGTTPTGKRIIKPIFEERFAKARGSTSYGRNVLPQSNADGISQSRVVFNIEKSPDLSLSKPDLSLSKANSQTGLPDLSPIEDKKRTVIAKEPLATQTIQTNQNMTVQSIPSSLNSKLEMSTSKKVLKTLDVSEEEKALIDIYFRHRFSTFLRITEEKIKMNLMLYRGNLTIKKTDNKATIDPSIGAQSKLPDSSETLAIEDCWRHIKRMVSTKSKYKARELGNFEKKVGSALKQLTSNLHPSVIGGKNQGKSGSYAPDVDLNDEKDSPVKKNTGEKSEKKEKVSKRNNEEPVKDPAQLKAENNFRIKKSNNPSAKIFIIIGGYPDLRNALLARGWIENPDRDSNQFNLKWTLKKADLNFLALPSNQYVNHFEKNTSITTKNGLCRNLKNLIWFHQENIDEFYPRCFDLNDFNEFDDFVEDFKFSEAEKVLKSISLTGITKRPDYSISVFKLLIALYVCERRLKDINEALSRIAKGIQDNVSMLEWEVLNSVDPQILTNPRYQSLLTTAQKRYSVSVTDDEENLIKNLQQPIMDTISALNIKFTQSRMNTGRNIWIVKPAGLSRGRGISCYDNLPAILNHIKYKETEWVAQKYLENLLVVKNRKFDIRQWVVVTDWAPLTVWFYERCYIRFTADEYDPENLSNKYAHLTNNSIGKHSKKFDNSEIEGNMWSDDEFANYLKESTGRDIFNELIKPKMRRSVLKSLICVQDMVETRGNSFELYGYDFMVDEDFNAWLIEINSSPAMDYSTKITEKLVKKVLTDVVKVVVDVQMEKKIPSKDIDTGDFTCIYRGNTI